MKQKKQHPHEDLSRGTGGELHQTAGGDTPVLTTQQGTPVSDDQNSLRVGPPARTYSERILIVDTAFL